MKVKRNKNKGNSLILLLVIISLITIIGGTLTTAVAYTTKQNSRVKVEEDLLYAAESGLEYVRAQLKSNSIVLNNIVIGNAMTNPPILPNTIFNPYGISVGINIKRDTETSYTVTSTATKGTKSKVVKGKINIGSDSQIYKYVLCAEKITTLASGYIDDSVTLWSVKNKPNSNIVYTDTKNGNKKIDITWRLKENQLAMPNFNFEPYKKNGVVSAIPIGDNRLTYDLDELDRLKNGVRKVTMSTTTGIPFNIYLVNTPEIIIKASSAMNLDSTIIICNGKITIIPLDGMESASITLNKSTIFGKEFNFKLGTFTSQYRLVDNDDKNFDLFKQQDIVNINNKLKEYGTGLGGEMIGSGSTGEITDIEYP